MRNMRSGPCQGETHVKSKSSEKGNNIGIRHIVSRLEKLEKYNTDRDSRRQSEPQWARGRNLLKHFTISITLFLLEWLDGGEVRWGVTKPSSP